MNLYSYLYLFSIKQHNLKQHDNNLDGGGATESENIWKLLYQLIQNTRDKKKYIKQTPTVPHPEMKIHALTLIHKQLRGENNICDVISKLSWNSQILILRKPNKAVSLLSIVLQPFICLCLWNQLTNFNRSVLKGSFANDVRN